MQPDAGLPFGALRDLIRSGRARNLRLDAGIKQRTMARALGIPFGSLFNFETRRQVPQNPDVAARYARVLRGLANHQAVMAELPAEEMRAA